MKFKIPKIIFGKFIRLISEILLKFGIITNSPFLCAKAWSLVIFEMNYLNSYFFYKRSSENKNKKILVLYRVYGEHDLGYVKNLEENNFNFLFFPRRYIKTIYENFFSSFEEKLSDDNYFSNNQDIEKAKDKYQKFLIKILKILNNSNTLKGIISFNFRYHSEKELHKACEKIGIKFIVCQKESLLFKGEKNEYIKINKKNGKFSGSNIIVYNENFKKLLVENSICEENKIYVTGMPRADYYFQNVSNSKKNHILFFIPTVRQPYGYKGNFFNKEDLTTKVTQTLLDFAEKNKKEKIIFKSKIYYATEIALEKLIKKKKFKQL